MTVTYKVQLVGSDKIAYEITYAGLRAALGVDTLNKREDHRFNLLWERVNDLVEETERLYLPLMEKKILAFVRDNPDCRTSQFTTKLWRTLKGRAQRGAFARALEKLEETGAIMPTSHGGANRTWRLGAAEILEGLEDLE